MNSPSAPRHGNWLQTFTGKAFWPLDPRPEDVCDEDSAHALALSNRYMGHTRVPYSVADHSLGVANVVWERTSDLKLMFAALLHDASEAYIVDVPRPIKPYLKGYYEIEAVVMGAILEHYGLPQDLHLHPEIKRADEILLATEARDLMAPPPAEWNLSHGPMEKVIVPLPWQDAERYFLSQLRRFHQPFIMF